MNVYYINDADTNVVRVEFPGTGKDGTGRFSRFAFTMTLDEAWEMHDKVENLFKQKETNEAPSDADLK